jgi:hypothetical protein
MTETGALPSRLDLSDDLFVASTLFAVMSVSEADMPWILEIFASAVEHCQALVEALVRIDRRRMP